MFSRWSVQGASGAVSVPRAGWVDRLTLTCTTFSQLGQHMSEGGGKPEVALHGKSQNFPNILSKPPPLVQLEDICLFHGRADCTEAMGPGQSTVICQLIV